MLQVSLLLRQVPMQQKDSRVRFNLLGTVAVHRQACGGEGCACEALGRSKEGPPGEEDLLVWHSFLKQQL